MKWPNPFSTLDIGLLNGGHGPVGGGLLKPQTLEFHLSPFQFIPRSLASENRSLKILYL